MDAERLLQRLCERHGLDPVDAHELLPLIQRAIASPDEVRRRIFGMVEVYVQRRAEGDSTATLAALEQDLDDEVLRAVARTIHRWDPPWRKGVKGQGTQGRLDLSSGDLPEGLGGGL
ncbi:MAG: hypothetical protein AAF957_25395 [Planctomycetota bacterium]